MPTSRSTPSGRDHPQHPRLRGRLPRRRDDPARAELPLHPDDPDRRQRGDQPQPGPQGRRTSGPTPAPASRSSATSPTTSTTRPSSSPTRSTGSPTTAGAKPGDVAVFYRTNAQSRVFEEVFIRVGLPYKVVGGVRFYERKEVRDALAYLRMLVNPDDDVIAAPDPQRAQARHRRPGRGLRRGAGAARAASPSAEALRRAEEAPGIATRSVTPIQAFVAMVDELQRDGRGGRRPDEVLEATLDAHRLPRGAAGSPPTPGRDPGREPRRARRGGPRVRASRADARRRRDTLGRSSWSGSRWSPTPTRSPTTTATTAAWSR